MLIDWFTVGAQVLNFLILVWVLKRFLYKPILRAIDAREELIAKELAEAAESKSEAQKEHDEFQHKNEEFDKQRAELLSKATDEAASERQRLLGEARKTADALSAKRLEAMRKEALSLNQSLSRRAQEEVFAIARKALTDLAATSLEERMVETFTLRLRGMDGQAKASMGEALKTAPEPAHVRSAFDLPSEQREVVRRAVNETFSVDIHLRFETAPDLVSGIDLSANGQRVGWSIGNYLASLNKGVGDLLKEKERPEARAPTASHAKAEPKPEAAVPPKPEAEAEPRPEVSIARSPHAKVEPKAVANAEPTSEAPKPEPQST